MRPAIGTGDAFTPNVRFIFATFRPLDELLTEGILPEDFFRRLGGRTLAVPPLHRRKEDIPLFVEHLLDDRPRRHCFLLALLLHDWHAGQVDELMRTVRQAAARCSTTETVTVAHLHGLLPECIIAYVTSMGEEEAERETYLWMARTLRAQGFAQGAGLQVRMAKLLCVSPATVSRKLKSFAESQPDVGTTGTTGPAA